MDLHGRFSGFVNAQGIVPRSPSPAVHEETAFSHPESIRTVVAQANQLIEVAADHLTAFVKTITPPVETLAPWTCVRAILESGAVAAWLLDGSLDAKSRVGRSLALRYEGLEQQRKYCQLNSAPVARETAQRIEELEKKAASLGFTKLLGRDGKRIGIGVAMPAATSLVRDSLNEEDSYRLLSGVVHGHFWAVYPLGFRPVDLAEPTQVPGYRASQKQLNILGMQALAAIAAGVLGRVAWRQGTYYGWDLKGLRQAFEPPFGPLSVPDQKRPWS